ncbi:SGNH/GDSL hydrolase family protein [Saccharomonospora saliphila]|uniref:SGNH/GDSL hydrolase family protein n=1 Tax=Saccharomonospora saliphila TaxID=369829 RepID=UPI00036D18D6|nr:SGNH/GDSL hydrolase family protein [Saccharomonospora saliphila]
MRAGLVLGAAALVVAGCAAPQADPKEAPTWCSDRSSALVLGDSLSTGWGLPGYEGDGGYAETDAAWSTRLARRAAEEWGTSTTVLAHNGATASDFLPGGRWPETAGAAETAGDLMPALVLVVVGANDFSRDVDPAEFDEHYRRVVDDLAAASPRSTVLHVIQYELGAREAEDPRYPWDTYADVIETVAADEGNEVLDLREYLPAGDTEEAEGLFLPDRAHLNPAGQRLVRAVVWTYLDTWCGGARS